MSMPPELDLQLAFPGDSVMAQRCRAFDWERTSLGLPARWPAALRTMVRTVLEAPAAICLWCGPDRVLLYNDAYRSVLGLKDAHALGWPGHVVWGEIWADIAALFTQIESGGRPTYAENARFLMDRELGPPGEAFFTFSLSAIRDEDGTILAVLNTAVETTAHVLSERAVQQARAAAEHAESRLRSVFAQAPAFLAVLHGPDHTFEFVNDAYRELINQRPVVGIPLRDALPEVAEQGFVDLLDEVLATGIPYVGRAIPVKLHSLDAGALEQLYLDFVYQPWLGSDGTRTGIVVFGTNVTDMVQSRREAERLLQESEAARASMQNSESRYRFLADAIPVHVWTATPDGMLDFVNERTQTYLGLPLDQILGAAWLSSIHPDDVERATERWKHSLTTGEPYEIEFRIRSAEQGSHRWHLTRASAQRDDAGNIIRWFGTNTDIEEWKAAEAHLQRLTREAQEANRSKGDFLAAMSHELRTPLNAIGGYAQLIELGVRGPVTDEQKLDLRRIQRSKAHLDGLVSGVLDFAKMGAGHIELRTVPIEAEGMLLAVVDMVRPQLSDKGLTLDMDTIEPGTAVEGDLDRTSQIVLNLLANAIKFTPSGGRLKLSVKADERQVGISLSDSGIGIAREQLDSIFEPFVQAKTPLHVAGIGVGLGLAISRQLARAMGGDVTVNSAVGEGSTFTLALPRHRPAAAAE